MAEAVQNIRRRTQTYIKLGLSAAIVFQLFCVLRPIAMPI
jgi:hypothetical protein